MTDLEHILPLWREIEASGADYVLATLVAVEGPSYRKPGALMLLAADGRRAGTISGGCLEAEVARRAWWLTESGPTIERYSTADDNGEMPYGSGCGGVVHLLLERRVTASTLFGTLEGAFNVRTPLAIATVVEGPHIGQRASAGTVQFAPGPEPKDSKISSTLQPLAEIALAQAASFERRIQIDGVETRVWVDYRPARPGLWIFGAGDDAKPLMNLAREIGWFVAVADGRSHLATHERFRTADSVSVLPISELPGASSGIFEMRVTDAAIVMTHSFEQDSRILASLLADPRGIQLTYLGVLGPQRRTRELLAEGARLLGLSNPEDRAERWLAEMNAPTGLDLGAETPATIALSILAEIQRTLTNSTARPLREIRAVSSAVSN